MEAVNIFKISVLYEAILDNLDSIVNLHSDLIYKNYLLIELIEACQKVPELDLNRLVEVSPASRLTDRIIHPRFINGFVCLQRIMKFFGCDAEEDRVHFLRVLLVYENMEDVLKESPVDQVQPRSMEPVLKDIVL